jgi:hypothetical protein
LNNFRELKQEDAPADLTANSNEDARAEQNKSQIENTSQEVSANVNSIETF